MNTRKHPFINNQRSPKPNKSDSNNNSITKKRNHFTENNIKINHIHIGSDSQSRDLSSDLIQTSSANFRVFNTCHPGAPLETIIHSITTSNDLRQLSKDDCVVVIGSINNVTKVSSGNPKQYLQYFHDFF